MIQQWLSNKKVDEYLVSIAEKELILDQSTPETSILLKQAFTEQKDEGKYIFFVSCLSTLPYLSISELFISKNAVLQIVEIISTCLLQPDDHAVTLDGCASLAAYISSVLYTETLKLRYGTDLLLALFTLSCNTRLDTDTISQDTLWEVSTAWQDVVGTLCCCLEIDELKSVADQFAAIIEDEFLKDRVESFNTDEIVDKIVNFMRVVKKNNGFVVFKVLELFLERGFVPKWRADLKDVCESAQYARGSLASLYSPINCNTMDVGDERILKYFTWLSLTIDVLLTPIEAMENYEEDDEETIEMKDDDNSSKDIKTMIDASDDIYNVMLNLLYDVTLANVIKENYKMVSVVKS